jgi:hypothetical protein
MGSYCMGGTMKATSCVGDDSVALPCPDGQRSAWNATSIDQCVDCPIPPIKVQCGSQRYPG